jgi:hypothetical protein
MMHAPPTNELGSKMQQRLVAVPFPSRDRFSPLGLEPRFGVAACLRALDQDQGGRSGHGQIAIL